MHWAFFTGRFAEENEERFAEEDELVLFIGTLGELFPRADVAD